MKLDKESAPSAATSAAPPPAPVESSHNKSFWEIAEADDAPAQVEAKPSTIAPSATAPVLPKISNEAAEAGARAAVGAINITLTMLARPLINWRFKKECAKRFKSDLERAEELVVTDDTPADDHEAKLKKRYEAFLNKRDQKITGLRFSDTEESDLTFAFKDYFKTTGKTMSPEVMLYVALIGAIGTRGIDIMMWE